MIETFPAFSKLSIAHKEQIQAITAGFPPFSDFNFSSLYCWNTDGSAQVSLLYGNLVICLPDYLTGKPIYSILGKDEINASLDQLFEITDSLYLVPKPVIEHLKNVERYGLVPDRDNFDYLYQVSNLVDLPGIEFKKKRNKTNRVAQDFGERISVVTSDNVSDEQARMLLAIFRQWSSAGFKEEHEIAAELRAFTRLLEQRDDFDLILTQIIVDGQSVAFSINELLNGDFAICHFEKSTPVHPNIYTYLTHETAKALQARGCTYENWEQDLGLEGLRSSKMAYKPTYFLEKYTITRPGQGYV